MAVWSYAQEDNWDRTQTRLLHLPTSEVAAMSAEILEHAAAQGQAAETLQRIARLATAYGATGPGIDVYADEGAGQGIAPPVGVTHPTPTAALVGRTPTTEATATPRPRPSPTAVAGASQGASATVEAGVPLDSFTIVSQTLSCEPEPYLAVSLELSRTVEIEGGKFSNRLAYPCARSGLSGTAVPIGRSPDCGSGKVWDMPTSRSSPVGYTTSTSTVPAVAQSSRYKWSRAHPRKDPGGLADARAL